MAKRTAIDGDNGEQVELDGERHCFIVRFGDDQFDAILEHQSRLARVLRKPISRAAAVRDIVGRTLPKRRRAADPRQLGIFGVITRDPRVAAEVGRTIMAAEKRAEARR